MKNGTLYARKLKAAYAKFRGLSGERAAEHSDPLEQLILAVLSQEASLAKAHKALKQLQQDMVDYNELRVSTPAEISESIGRIIPRSVQQAKVLVRLLNAIYQREYAVSLNVLTGKGIREVKAYLDSLDGMTPYVAASIVLWSLGGHAIPVSDPVLEFLRKHELVDPGASAAEVQSFLERNISAADARSFCLDLDAYVASKPFFKAESAKSGKAERASADKSGGAAKSRSRKKAAGA